MAKILIVEDDADSREAMSRYLTALGHTVIAEADGRLALKALFRDDPDIIVLDLRLPGMDGLGFLKVIRSYMRFRSQPVIVTTGVDDQTMLAAVEDVGVKQIFRKGNYEFADLRRAIDAELQHGAC